MNDENDTYSYKGWLVSDHFIKRAFAVLGHAIVAQLIVYGGILAIGIVLTSLTRFH